MHAGEEGKPVAGFTPDALAALRQYPWPGNVRELEFVVHRGVLVAEGQEITAADLRLPAVPQPGPPASTPTGVA